MIVGTAGHVDHGKSALIRALTGVDTDRLAEEKRRGISIELGFAYLPTGDGAALGFVDVPGHENFIHHMLAGATGIDFVLLVVAADDGVMPQTAEHLAILDLLGLTRGLVALTKVDRVTAPRRAAVAHDIARLLAPTGLAGAPIIEVSAVTVEGVAEVRARLIAAARTPPTRDAGGLFRLAVDRCFTLRGVGTLVTGTVLSGAVAVGDHMTISPPGLAARVRSIHAQNQAAARGEAGQRCALNLAGEGVTKAAIARGDMVVAPSLHAPTQRIDARLRVLASEAKPLGLWLPARLHHGASDVGARVVPLDTSPLAPGGEGWVQLVLDRPIAAASGDRFVLRGTSARRTIGGGRFIDLRPPSRRRRTPERLKQLAAMAAREPSDSVAALLDLPPYYLDLTAFLRDRALAAAPAAQPETIHLPVGGAVFVLSGATWARLQKSLAAVLASFHSSQPAARGETPDRLRRAAEPRLPPALFAAALDELARQRTITMEAGLVRLPDHASRFAPAQEALWQKIRPLLAEAARFDPPRLGELVARVGMQDRDTRLLLKRAAGLGLIEEVAPGHFFLRAAIAEIAGIVGALADTAPDGQFGAAQLRDRIGTGRKAAIELLEYLDRRGITMRRGDLRRIDARKLDLLR